MSTLMLKDALRDALERRGTLGSLRASIRQEIFATLEDRDQDAHPRLHGDNLIINELIREYLEFNQYRHSLAVFLPETGQPKDSLPRSFVAQRTRLPERVGSSAAASHQQDLPLLYALLAPEPPLPPPEQSPPDSPMQPALDLLPPPPPPPISATIGGRSGGGGVPSVHARPTNPGPVIFNHPAK